MPNIPHITPETAHSLRWKAIKYLLRNDPKRIFLRHFFRHPIRYGRNLLASYLQKKPYGQDGDFLFYNLQNDAEWIQEAAKPSSLVVVGFSYCHKPFECPSGRFTDQCIHDPSHPVCGQCFIGKISNALPEKVTLLSIPTIHYIGEKMFELATQNPKKQIVFLITSCELSLKMFADWGNLLGLKGIGVRLQGRICNTMKAFTLSEHGVKPGLTTVTSDTERRMCNLVQNFYQEKI